MQTPIMCGRTRGATSIFINDNVTKEYTVLSAQNKTFKKWNILMLKVIFTKRVTVAG